MKDLTVLSFGGGQDSTAILLKLIFDQTFRAKYAPEELLVIMSDTGNEHPHTYENVITCQKLCLQHNIEFKMIRGHEGFHAPSWTDLISPQIRPENSPYKETMVQLGTKSCTINLKVTPIYKFLDEWLNEKMGYDFPIRKTRGCDKRAIKKYMNEVGRVRVLLGFAAGEESRAEKSKKLEANEQKSEKHIWQKIIKREYPLIVEGMGRDECQALIESKLGKKVFPSNCMLCPYQSPPELLWLYLNFPDEWAKWVSIEERKISRHQGLEKNHGVYNSKKLLPQRLTEAKEKYGHLTDEELNEYKYSHGCATNAI